MAHMNDGRARISTYRAKLEAGLGRVYTNYTVGG